MADPGSPGAVPQRLVFVTLGARDLPRLRRFYRRLGWVEIDGSDDGFAAFHVGGVRLALYPVELLRDEAAPGEALPDAAAWNGVTLAVNVAGRDEVDAAFAHAVARGATSVAEPTERDWGGYSAYVADPEGNRWELAWSPHLDLD